MNFRSCISISVALIASISFASPQGSSRTTDSKYGFSVVGPKGWKKETGQTDGYISFVSPDEKARFTLTGEWQTKRMFAKAAATEFLKGLKQVRQTQIRATGYSVSWVDDNRVWFRREEFGNRVMSRFELNFPTNEEAKYGAILKEVQRTYIPAQDAEVAERMKAFASVANLEQLLVFNGNEISWDSCEELILVGKHIIKPLAEMLSKTKIYREKEATGSFPSNALYILARINEPEVGPILKSAGDDLGFKAWTMRRKGKESNLGLLGREGACFAKPDNRDKPIRILPVGTVLEFIERVVNPAIEGPRGGSAVFDRVKIPATKQIVYLMRPGMGAIRLCR